MAASKVVLVTGASSGIGKAIAETLMQEGYLVYGTSRKQEPGSVSAIATSPAGGALKMIYLDVCSDESAQQAVAQIWKTEGRLDILVNNAGFGIAGAVELTTSEEVCRQLNTNFLGVQRMCRQVLPIMRRQKEGRIINIGSVMGIFAIQFQSVYSVSKFALEALTEAMRIEVRPFGIKVTLVQAGDTRTGFVREFVAAAKEDRVYAERFINSINGAEKAEKSGHRPEIVAKEVLRMIKKKHPPVRVTVGWLYKLFRFLKRFAPDRLVEYVVTRFY